MICARAGHAQDEEYDAYLNQETQPDRVGVSLPSPALDEDYDADHAAFYADLGASASACPPGAFETLEQALSECMSEEASTPSRQNAVEDPYAVQESPEAEEEGAEEQRESDAAGDAGEDREAGEDRAAEEGEGLEEESAAGEGEESEEDRSQRDEDKPDEATDGLEEAGEGEESEEEREKQLSEEQNGTGAKNNNKKRKRQRSGGSGADQETGGKKKKKRRKKQNESEGAGEESAEGEAEEAISPSKTSPGAKVSRHDPSRNSRCAALMRFRRQVSNLRAGKKGRRGTFKQGNLAAIPKQFEAEAMSLGGSGILFERYWKRGCCWKMVVTEEEMRIQENEGIQEREWKFCFEMIEIFSGKRTKTSKANTLANMQMTSLKHQGLWRYHPDMLHKGRKTGPPESVQYHALIKDIEHKNKLEATRRVIAKTRE